jgi:CDGSH-type Zn-finger protein
MAREDVVIVPYRDGPYLVRGPLVLRDQKGRPIELGRRTVALCRCGKSRMRPFCDGTHRLVAFRAPSAAEDPWTQQPAAAPAPSPGSERPALAALRRARDQAVTLLGASASEGDGAPDEPLTLIDAACTVLASRGRRPELAAKRLLEGAVGALAPAGDRAVMELAAQVAAVAEAL